MINAFVEKLKGFGSLNHDDEARLQAACHQTRSYLPKSDLIRDGDEPGPVFVILKGWAVRYKILPDGNRQIIAFMMPGDFCDMHVAALDRMDHSIGALTPVTVATIQRREMEILVGASAALALAFWRTQLVDAAVLRATIVSMGRRNSLDRVAHLLCELCLRLRSIVEPLDGRYVMPFSQIILADATGLTPVHINRTLRKLQTARAIELAGGAVVISDLATLATVAGFDDNYLHRRCAA